MRWGEPCSCGSCMEPCDAYTAQKQLLSACCHRCLLIVLSFGLLLQVLELLRSNVSMGRACWDPAGLRMLGTVAMHLFGALLDPLHICQMWAQVTAAHCHTCSLCSC